ncbi:hypothetical protein GOBAR_DD04989 [Gossypium barbadense]|nr:hypothetical protein GOBAR_DD04989 [Gossypium barbadense]
MRKKVDERIRTLIENGVKNRHRSMFVIIGDKSRDQIVNLHYMLSKAVVKSRPTVLWCYKDKLELSSHKKKRAKQIKKLMQRGLLDPEKVDPFSLFVETGGLTYCLYKDSERILGNTFGMCILQDFEALTPNLLARTIETVQGGGLIILLLRSLSSLTSLYTMVMDPEGLSESERDLKNLKQELSEDFPVGPLIKKCCTLDQGKAVVTFLDAILDKSLRSTVALLAARGRGKSAALGLAVAGAIAAGYSNIYVTAPSPENLKTLFEFVCKGFDAIEYKEHIDYDVVKSVNPEFKKATVRINIYKQHRQTIQYIQPHEHEKLSQVELLVVDEAAAITIACCEVLACYEGTGRSLSLKLLQQLEEQSQLSKGVEGSLSGRVFKKIELSESIRYASADPIECWLNALLCLDVTNSVASISRLPPPSECDLYYVDRDTLFSYHKDSELFLQRMMALYVSSHYKNSPNDLQLMADAPAHHLFVLLGPVDESKNQLPDILCVIQVSLEGQISRKSAIKSLSVGYQPHGDQIPWKFCEQFRDPDFPSLSGARIVRIATHPSAMRLGYGSAAIELLTRYYEGQLRSFSELDVEDAEETPQGSQLRLSEAAEKVSLLEENIKPKTDLPPLLVHLRERRPEKLHYLGVSFGLTLDLFRFWKKHKFAPFYICQIPNNVTGEHTCMVLKPLNNDDFEVSGCDEWEFKLQFSRNLSRDFRDMEYKLAMSVLDPKMDFTDIEPAPSKSDELSKLINTLLSPYDMGRLKDYSNNLIDYLSITDLLSILAHLYFQGKIPVTLTYVQASILLCMGLQNRDVSYVEEQLKKALERQQILSYFKKVMIKLYKYLYGVASKEIESALPRLKERVLEPHSISVDEDLNDAAKKVEEEMKGKSDGVLNPQLLQQFAIEGREGELEDALENGGEKVLSGGVISVKSSRSEVQSNKSGKKRGKDEHGSKSTSKKRKS